MSNLHPNLSDDQLHVAKGFSSASNGQLLWRNEKGAQSFDNSAVLPQALSLTSSYSTPPTQNEGDIYLLDGTANHADWDGIALNSWARYDGTTWYGITPEEGVMCYEKLDDELKIYDGTAWSTFVASSSSGILLFKYSNEQTTATTGLEILETYVLQGGTVEEGDVLEVEANWQYAANTNNKRSRIKCFNEVIGEYTSNISQETVCIIARFGNYGGVSIGTYKSIPSSGTIKVQPFLHAADWTANTDIEFTGENFVASAGDILLFDLSIKLIKAVS